MNEQLRQDVIDKAKALLDAVNEHRRALTEMRSAAVDPATDILNSETIDVAMAAMDISMQDCSATEASMFAAADEFAALRAAESAAQPEPAPASVSPDDATEKMLRREQDAIKRILLSVADSLDALCCIERIVYSGNIPPEALLDDHKRVAAVVIAQLIAHFDEHAWHDTGCGTRHPGPGECDCGFEEARKEVAAMTEGAKT